NRDRHQGRLGIFGELEGFGRAVPYDGRQLLAKRRINFVEDCPRGRKGFRQSLAHTDRLGTLPRKCKCSRHRRSLIKIGGRKTLTKAGMSSRGAASRGPAWASYWALEAACGLIATNFGAGPRAAHAARQFARPI